MKRLCEFSRWPAVVALVCAATGQPLDAQGQDSTKSRGSLAAFSESIETLARNCSPAVVLISVKERGFVSESEGQRTKFVAEQQGSGSGVIVDSEGYIITNAHVVEDARKIDVTIHPRGGEAYQHYAAKFIGIDHETDLAVLRVNAVNLPYLSFANSETLKQGQLVVALGSPLGLDNSLSVGFISAPVRHLGASGRTAYIQTDTPINPGNSGGPLLDINGEIAGITTMIMSQSGGNEGIGFAIPSNIVKRVYQGIRKDGRIRRGEIGVASQDITPIMSAALSLGAEAGVILADVTPHGSAEAAGLEPGDVVLKVDGKPIHASRELEDAVFEHSARDQLTLEIKRGAEHLTKTVAVLQQARSLDDLAQVASRDAKLVRRLGILALTVDEKITPLMIGLRRLEGVAVGGIPAEFAGLNPGLLSGDVIYELNGVKVVSVEQLRTLLDGKPRGAPLTLQIERNGNLMFIAFELE